MEIDRDAPVTASAESLIRAPLDLVWSVVSGIESWPGWNPEVARAELRGPLAVGSVFRWTAGGAPTVSMIEQVVPELRLAWTGRMLSIRAIHVWSFEEREDGVLARTEESFDGLLARLLRGPIRGVLASSLQQQVEALRAECERRAAAGMA